MPLILDAKKSVKPFLNCVHLHFFKKLGMEFLLENFETTHVEILSDPRQAWVLCLKIT